LGIGPDALSVDAEFEWRSGLPALAGEDAGMALETAENFGQPQAARLEIAERCASLALGSCPRRELILARPVDRGDRRNGTERRKRR
jgi:hypothetical protein